MTLFLDHHTALYYEDLYIHSASAHCLCAYSGTTTSFIVSLRLIAITFLLNDEANGFYCTEENVDINHISLIFLTMPLPLVQANVSVISLCLCDICGSLLYLDTGSVRQHWTVWIPPSPLNVRALLTHCSFQTQNRLSSYSHTPTV